jgi:cobalt-zinc-cadmium efflux system protein
MSHDHGLSSTGQNRKALWITFGLTFSFFLVELFGVYWTKSLALLADAGHMFTDVAGIGFALFASWIAQRPASVRKTYGYYRVEILTAAANAVLLFGISGYILYEAYQRFQAPPEIVSTPLLFIAIFDLIMNIVGMLQLHKGSKESLNVEGAFLEVASDALGSIGVIIGALIIHFTKWYYIDPIIAALIGIFIIPRTWKLLMKSVNILMEGTPEGIHIEEVEKEISSIDGVKLIHDLHIWTITSGVNALSGHVVVTKDMTLKDSQALLDKINSRLEEKFHIEHTTLQFEPHDSDQANCTDCRPK